MSNRLIPMLLFLMLTFAALPAAGQDYLSQFGAAVEILTIEVQGTLEPLQRRFLEKLKNLQDLNDKSFNLYKKAAKLRDQAPSQELIDRIARETKEFCREIGFQKHLQRGPAGTDLDQVRRMVEQYRINMDGCLQDLQESVRHCQSERQARAAQSQYRRCKSEMDKIIDLEQSLSFMAMQVEAGVKVLNEAPKYRHEAAEIMQAISQFQKDVEKGIKDASDLADKWEDNKKEISNRAAAVYQSVIRHYPDGPPPSHDKKWSRLIKMLNQGGYNRMSLGFMASSLDKYYLECSSICDALNKQAVQAQEKLNYLNACTKSAAWPRLKALLQFLVQQKAEAGIIFLAARDTILKGIKKCRSAGMQPSPGQPLPPPPPVPGPAAGPAPAPQASGAPPGFEGTWEIRQGLRVRFLRNGGPLAAYVVESTPQLRSKYPQGLMVIRDINPVGPNRYEAKVLVWGGTAKNWVPLVLAPQGETIKVFIGKMQGRYRRVGP